MAPQFVIAIYVVAAVERLAEAALSSRNARRLLENGAVEHGQTVTAALVGMHVTMLLAISAEFLLTVRTVNVVAYTLFVTLFFASLTLRLWVLRSLGGLWSFRLLVPPKLVLVTTGPYRCVRHPNYASVLIETLSLTLIGGTYITAAICVPAVSLLLLVRIRQEEQALRTIVDYEDAFLSIGRLVPNLARRGQKPREPSRSSR